MLDEAAVRRQKLEHARELGMDPYPSTTNRSATCREALAFFETGDFEGKTVTLTGRLFTIRLHGGMLFADLWDETGKVQLAFKQDNLGEKPFQELCDLVDPGDIVEAVGTLFVTKRGEKSLEISSWRLLTKALLPLPEKWHGLQDVEQRFRKRYLDLLMNPEARLRLLSRTKMIASIRALMGEHGFIEVETPTLQPVYGGGFARPFKTHHNALDTDFYLRISDEMYLKRLIVGGLERVYEITKVFRNEGIDHDHSPEFTMFEAQIAYQDYRFGMDLFEEIFERASIATSGGTEITHGDVTINVKRPWKRLSLVDAVKEIGKVDVSKWKNVEDAKKFLATKLKEPRKVTELERMKTLGEVIAFAFEELVEEKLIQPTIIYDYPVEVSPLAKKKADDPAFTERFETFALGSEIGNNYSELNDPVDLEKRFVEEKKKEAAGFEEAHQTDEEYLEAIRHGMPPTCGLGIGIDRMAMLLTGAENIKEVVFFPTLRPKEKEEEEA